MFFGKMAGGIAKIIQYRNFPRLGRMHFSKGAGILRVSSLSLPAHFSWSTPSKWSKQWI
jgi:hypothetical protein